MRIASRVRPERPEDHAAVEELVRAAFLGMPYSEGDEAEVVRKLRDAGALSVSLVAEVGGSLAGHIAFSPAHPEDGSRDWYALGPLAVRPVLQRRGVGISLVNAGLAAISALGASGCIVVGDTGYYTRFGFVPSPDHAPSPGLAAHFMVKVLRGPLPAGHIRFHRAFGADG